MTQDPSATPPGEPIADATAPSPEPVVAPPPMGEPVAEPVLAPVVAPVLTPAPVAEPVLAPVVAPVVTPAPVAEPVAEPVVAPAPVAAATPVVVPAPETNEAGWGLPPSSGSLPPAGPSRWPLILTSALTVAGLLVAVVLGWLLVDKGNKEARQLPSRGRDALVVASRFAGNVTTYDYHELTADFARVLADSAGKFKDDFAKTTAASGQFIKLVETYKGIAKGEVSDVALERLDGDTAIVVMLVTQTVQNSNRPAPQVTRTDGRITLSRLQGRWLVTDFKVV